MPDQISCPDSFVTPLNGERVTLARLYEELYNLDQGLSRRFTAFFSALEELRSNFEEHRGDGHPFSAQAEITKEELRLDTKRIALAGAFFTLLAGLAGVVGAFIGNM